MATKEKLFAQFTLMNYLQGSHGDRTVQEILEHVRNNTTWGRAQLERALSVVAEASQLTSVVQ